MDREDREKREGSGAHGDGRLPAWTPGGGDAEPPPAPPPRPVPADLPPPRSAVRGVRRAIERRRGNLDFGSTLGRGVGAWIGNLPAFTLIALLLFAPVILVSLLYIEANPPPPGGGIDEALRHATEFRTFVDVIHQFVLQAIWFVLAGIIAFATFEHLRGRRVGIGRSLEVGFRSILTVLGVFLVVTLLLGLIPYLVDRTVEDPGEQAMIGLLILVPILILTCGLFVAVPVAVVEKRGVLRSIARSFDLTRGSRWTIFGLLFVIGLVEGGSTLVAVEVLTPRDANPFTHLRLLHWIVLGGSFLFAPVKATIATVAYHDLRAAKEGVGIDELVAVFE